MEWPLQGEYGISDAADPRAARLRGDMRLAEVRFLPHPSPFHQLPRTLVREDRPCEHAVVAADPNAHEISPREALGTPSRVAVGALSALALEASCL